MQLRLVLPAMLAAMAAAAPNGLDEGGDEPWCVLHRFNMRDSTGEPIQFVTNEDGSVEATLCEGTKNFFISAEPVEPTFASGAKCKLAGVPGNPMPVELGTQVELEIHTYETNPKEPAERTPIAVRRLGIGEDQSPCAITRVRSAAQDCGYAPFLEEQRQVAAMNPGSAMAPPQAPVDEVTVGAGASAALLEGQHVPPPRPAAKRYLGRDPARKLRIKAEKRERERKAHQRRSAKWSHLRHHRGISGLDGC